MLSFLAGLWPVFLLCFAVCIDTFAAAFGFGAAATVIPPASAVILSCVSAATLTGSVVLSSFLAPFIPDSATRFVSFFILFSLGLYKAFESGVKKAVRKLNPGGKRLQFSFMRLRFLLHIYADPAAADADESHHLSFAEAAALGLALSSDGIAAGLGTGFMGFSPLWVFGFSLALNVLCILAGCAAGQKAAKFFSFDLSLLGAFLLIFMSIFTLFS